MQKNNNTTNIDTPALNILYLLPMIFDKDVVKSPNLSCNATEKLL